MKKIKKIEVTLWGKDYVGSLPEAAEWFRRQQILPPIGSSIPLPSKLTVAKSKPEDADGYTTESIDIEIDEIVGTVTSIFFSTNADTICIGVTPGSVATRRGLTNEPMEPMGPPI